jgi:hypothetical protein
MTPSGSLIMARSPQHPAATSPSKRGRKKGIAPTLPLPASLTRATSTEDHSKASAKATSKHVPGQHHRDQRSSETSHNSNKHKSEDEKDDKKSDKHTRDEVSACC